MPVASRLSLIMPHADEAGPTRDVRGAPRVLVWHPNLPAGGVFRRPSGVQRHEAEYRRGRARAKAVSELAGQTSQLIPKVRLR